MLLLLGSAGPSARLGRLGQTVAVHWLTEAPARQQQQQPAAAAGKIGPVFCTDIDTLPTTLPELLPCTAAAAAGAQRMPCQCPRPLLPEHRHMHKLGMWRMWRMPCVTYATAHGGHGRSAAVPSCVRLSKACQTHLPQPNQVILVNGWHDSLRCHCQSHCYRCNIDSIE
jgi:hypothetical protein